MFSFKNLFVNKGSIEQKEFNGATQFINLPSRYDRLKGEALLKEGYKHNVIAYACVQKIFKAIQNINIQLVDGNEKLVEKSDVMKLLKRPNPVDSKSSFLEKIFIQRLVLGEMFISANIINGKPKELWEFSPLQMVIIPGNHIPKSYVHEVNGQTVEFPVNPLTGESEMFFWKGEDPAPDKQYRGMSPLVAASLAADTNNQGLKWNHSLLKNGSRGSGILNFEKKPSEADYKKVREWWKVNFQGSRNAGEVPVTWGGTKYQELGQSPKDMDFVSTLDKTTSFIATAYGVPLPLILSDSSTFNNMDTAKEMFYMDTVIPLYQSFLDSFGNWLLPKFKLEGHKFVIDKDSIPALENMRAKRRESFTKTVAGGIVSPDEARVELGYDKRGGAADELYMPASSLPIEDDSRGDDNEETEA